MFTESELLAALEAALSGKDDDPPGAFTVADLARLTGAAPIAIRVALAEMKAAGRIEVLRVKRLRIDDRAVLIPAYRWKDAETNRTGSGD